MSDAPLYNDLAQGPEGGRAFFVRAKDDTRIRFALWQGGGRGLALVFPGRTECLEKYGRKAGKLAERGFSVAVIDWRGQGLSDRLNDSTEVGHVNHFADYQRDVEAMLSHPEIKAISGPRVLFAHSMGGCIGLRTVTERQDIAAAVFSAPMWGLNLPGLNKLMAPLMANIGTSLGFGKKPLPGQPKGFYLTREPFEGNNLTHDQDHWDYMREQIVQQPALALGPPSFRWLKEALAEISYLSAAPVPALPTLSFLGSEETIVSPPAIRQHMARFPDGMLHEISGSRHEIWMETPERLSQSWDSIDRFLTTSVTA